MTRRFSQLTEPLGKPLIIKGATQSPARVKRVNNSTAAQAAGLDTPHLSLPVANRARFFNHGCERIAPISNCTSLPLGSYAVCTSNALTQGTHTIAADYSGDSFNAPSSGSVQQTIVFGGGVGGH
jgi:hypothetical protein